MILQMWHSDYKGFLFEPWPWDMLRIFAYRSKRAECNWMSWWGFLCGMSLNNKFVLQFSISLSVSLSVFCLYVSLYSSQMQPSYLVLTDNRPPSHPNIITSGSKKLTSWWLKCWGFKMQTLETSEWCQVCYINLQSLAFNLYESSTLRKSDTK